MKEGRVFTIQSKLQLMLPLKVALTNGDEKVFKVLIDTGAQAHIVRSDLIPPI